MSPHYSGHFYFFDVITDKVHSLFIIMLSSSSKHAQLSSISYYPSASSFVDSSCHLRFDPWVASYIEFTSDLLHSYLSDTFIAFLMHYSTLSTINKVEKCPCFVNISVHHAFYPQNGFCIYETLHNMVPCLEIKPICFACSSTIHCC